MITAHKRQLKVSGDSRRKAGATFVFRGENIPHNSRKRRREQEAEDAAVVSEEEPDFYGFPAESFIFEEQTPIENQLGNFEITQQSKKYRRSERNAKKKRRSDFVYY